MLFTKLKDKTVCKKDSSYNKALEMSQLRQDHSFKALFP